MNAEVDAYLARLPDDARATLEILRRTIRAVAPEASEALSYGVPAFKMKRPIVSFGAGKNHLALYVLSTAVMEAHRGDLKGYDTSAGTVRFAVDEPLPAALVEKLVKARIAENEAKG